MGAKMTLEQVRDWHRQREITFRRLGAPDTANEHQDAADAIDAHLTQPAQSVDVEKVREVIEEIAEQWHGCMYDAPGETVDISDAIRRAGTRLITAALQESDR